MADDTLIPPVPKEVRDRLVESNLWIPTAVAARYAHPPRFPFDDLQQIGREELLRAAAEWDGRRDFPLLAWTRVRRRIADEFRRELGRGGHRADGKLLELTESREPRCEGGFAEAATVREIMDCRRRMAPTVWRTLVAVSVGLSQAEVARADGVTEGAVTLRMRQARRALS